MLAQLRKAGHSEDSLRALTMDKVQNFLRKDAKGLGVSLKTLAHLARIGMP